LDYVCHHWAGGELAWIVIEWVLSHDPDVGRCLTEKGSLRAFQYDGARSIKQPDLYVIYEVLPNEIVIKVFAYDEAQAGQAGRA
jgi:hypothetical protein